MSNAKLAAALVKAGCAAVQPLLASGNFVFESPARSTAQLESRIEQALEANVGRALAAFVLGRGEIEAMIRADPFKGAEHGKQWYLTVTFFKDRRPPVYSRLERATMDGPGFMAGLAKTYGDRITTRTWNTVLKVAAKMNPGPRPAALKQTVAPRRSRRSRQDASRASP